MATIHDVARAARVSAATVSRVLNSNASVMPHTRERVQEAIASLHYQPNQSSRNLRRMESRLLLVLTPDLCNRFYGEILAGMDAAAIRAGYKLFVSATYSDAARERALTAYLAQKQADGVIFMAPHLTCEELLALREKYPVVQCCEYNEHIAVSRVSIDNYAACYDAMAHLLAQGHRRIGMFSSNNGFSSTHQREAACRQALADHGIPWDDALLLRGTYTFACGVQLCRAMLRLPDPPTALLASCDVVAAGCLCALTDAGLTVPDDMSVMGFDDVDLCRMVRPALSSVAQPLTRLGETAVALLLRQLGGDPEPQAVLLPHALRLRSSIGMPRRAVPPEEAR